MKDFACFSPQWHCCTFSSRPSMSCLCHRLYDGSIPNALNKEIQRLLSAREQRLCTRWRLRLHIQLPPVQPRPPLSARRRVLFVLCCFQRLYLPPEMAFCVLQMLTLKELSLLDVLAEV